MASQERSIGRGKGQVGDVDPPQLLHSVPRAAEQLRKGRDKTGRKTAPLTVSLRTANSINQSRKALSHWLGWSARADRSVSGNSGSMPALVPDWHCCARSSVRRSCPEGVS